MNRIQDCCLRLNPHSEFAGPPRWRRTLRTLANTLLYYGAMRIRSFIPLALPVRARTFFQEEMLVILPEESACQIFRSGAIEEDVTSFLLAYCRESMTFIDVGANLGYFTLLAANLVQPSGCVHAFEPAQRSFKLLQKNTKRHPNITVHQKALWSSRATMRFYDYGPRYSALNSLRQHRLIQEEKIPLKRVYDVECITLDEYCTELKLAPDFIKIDAESSEPQVLRGSTHIIARYKPIISLEVWDDDSRKSRDDVAFLIEHGYTVFEYQAGEILPHRINESYTYQNLLFIDPGRPKSQAPEPARMDGVSNKAPS